VASGREWAEENDPSRRLAFTERNDDASGQEVMLVLGALQYFDYPLQDLLARLAQPPRHIIINLTPMHPSMDFHTVQNMGFCCVSYHVLAEPGFIAAMQACGYEVVDRWRSYERECHVPFAPDHQVDGYCGLYLRRIDTATA
jgi:putative methyltransferase (TIGR04325 family)